jgi:hypothetical protein
VEDVVPKPSPTEDTLVRLSCLDDDALGEALEVLWEREVDAQYIGATSWDSIANRGFDQPRLFSAYLHTLRWNCVTSTEPKLSALPLYWKSSTLSVFVEACQCAIANFSIQSWCAA